MQMHWCTSLLATWFIFIQSHLKLMGRLSLTCLDNTNFCFLLFNTSIFPRIHSPTWKNLIWIGMIPRIRRMVDFYEEFFCKLEVLRLYHKDDKLILVPSVSVEGLCYLKYLSISNLFFEEIFHVNNKGQYAGTFERLTKLNLSKMPKLMHLWKENSQQGRAFQNLEILHLSQCSRLKKIQCHPQCISKI